MKVEVNILGLNNLLLRARALIGRNLKDPTAYSLWTRSLIALEEVQYRRFEKERTRINEDACAMQFKADFGDCRKEN
jgi:hypothetical protein